ncbi:MAG: ATP-dependent zinc protease family protein [Candidatus Saccharimonadales bacterium]
MLKKEKTVIGRSERIAFPILGFEDIPARIDTGAGISAIGVQSVTEYDGRLEVVFFDVASPLFTGKKQSFSSFGKTEVRSSNGQSALRYTIRTQVVLGGRKIRATFTLADRSTQLYPVLIGRNVLRGKFIVDVKLGTSLAAEKQRQAEIKAKYSASSKE